MKKVVIADDDPKARMLFYEVLTEDGHQVHTATSPRPPCPSTQNTAAGFSALTGTACVDYPAHRAEPPRSHRVNREAQRGAVIATLPSDFCGDAPLDNIII